MGVAGVAAANLSHLSSQDDFVADQKRDYIVWLRQQCKIDLSDEFLDAMWEMPFMTGFVDGVGKTKRELGIE